MLNRLLGRAKSLATCRPKHQHATRQKIQGAVKLTLSKNFICVQD